MGIKSILSKPFAKIVANKIKKDSAKALEIQHNTLMDLVRSSKNTAFGKDHNFAKINTYQDFKNQVPIRDYEGLKDYVERIVDGEADVLWPGLPIYFCKTSGTTSGTKFIPLTKASMPHHISAARNAILLYIAETGKTDFVEGKMIFLQGSPELDTKGKIPYGRLSGIAAHYVPGYLQKNRMPTWETNCIEDWEEKLDKIIDETLEEKMTLISGIPPWVQMYFERIQARTGKKIKEVFPDFSLFIQGGVNYKPYVPIFDQLVGKKIDTIELYPASEGFIAYQDSQNAEGMLLNINAGIFYEFIPAEEFFEDNPSRLSLADVQVGVNYVIILNTNAGLWGYNIGDTVKFTSTDPYRIVVSGRIKHFISAFGEHVIGEEVDKAMIKACADTGAEVTEFTVAPQVDGGKLKLPYHEWLVEFAKKPSDMERFAAILDEELTQQNSYYKDLIVGNILRKLVIRVVPKNGFVEYMKSQGKLGGQNKVPRLSNDRKIADALIALNQIPT